MVAKVKSAPVFAPVTRVLEPLAIQAQKRKMLEIIGWATLALAVWLTVWMLAPVPGSG